jgi:hypothetical protein
MLAALYICGFLLMSLWLNLMASSSFVVRIRRWCELFGLASASGWIVVAVPWQQLLLLLVDYGNRMEVRAPSFW